MNPTELTKVLEKGLIQMFQKRERISTSSQYIFSNMTPVKVTSVYLNYIETHNEFTLNSFDISQANVTFSVDCTCSVFPKRYQRGRNFSRAYAPELLQW